MIDLAPYADGEQDATEALAAALASSRVVALPPGTYRTTAPLALSGELVGSDQRPEAEDCAIVADHDGPAIVVPTATARFAAASGFALLRKQGRARAPGILVSGADWTRGLTLRNLAIRGHGYGVHIDQAGTFAELHLSRCAITGNVRGLYSRAALTLSSITDANISQNWEGGVLTAGKGLRIVGCDLEGQPDPLVVSGTNNTAIHIDQCYFERNTGRAFVQLGLCHGFYVGHLQAADADIPQVRAVGCTRGEIACESAILRSCCDVRVGEMRDDADGTSAAWIARRWAPPAAHIETYRVPVAGPCDWRTMGAVDAAVTPDEFCRVALRIAYASPPSSSPTIIAYARNAEGQWPMVGKVACETTGVRSGDSVLMVGSFLPSAAGSAVRLYCYPYGEGKRGEGAMLSDARLWVGGHNEVVEAGQ